VNLLLTSPSALSPEETGCVEHIRAEAERMKELTESLLTLARSDSGHSQTVFEPLDFSYLVTSSTLTFEPVAFEQGKTITGEIENGLTVTGDKDKLRRLVDILMDNACKYSVPGSEIRADLARSPGGKRSGAARYLLLTVTSEGTPLTRDEIDHIFLRFYRTDPSRTAVPGYGLGLSIAQVIVREHGGEIQAFSDGASKNTFCVQLPLSGEA
ncbi:MAG: HAMP domain-containing histidine kinase, partial [Clostridiales bacterium]|nr:HAMP domain-containing histidine kinase [Clostridiales bacterium]